MIGPARRSPVAALALSALLAAPPLAAPAVSRGPEGAAAAGGDVAEEMRRICAAVRESEDPFYGVAREREIRRRLAGPLEDPVEAIALRAGLGRELLKLDRNEEAIELLTAAAAEGRERGLDPAFLLDVEVYLGLAHLQAGEDENCVVAHNAESCILPIAREAVHARPGHARRAGDRFLAIAREHPRAVHTLWLLNLARMVSGDWPAGVPEPFRLPAGALAPERDLPRWRDRAPELGLAVVDLAGGAVMEDFDGDGLLDLVSTTWDPCGGMKAFRNDGRGGFEDVSRAWGLDEQLGGLNLVHADFDGDRRPDLLVLRGAWMGGRGAIRNSLLRNGLGSEGGRFADVTRSAGMASPAAPTQTAAWADYDGDGDLDLYVGNEDPDGSTHPSQLFDNRGDGTFVDVAERAGVANHRFAKAVAWGDYDGDGDPDLYVSNIGPNRLYRNDGDGTFTDVAEELGVTEPTGRSFAAWFFDPDNDGDLDLFVADYESPVPAVSAHYFALPPLVDNRPRLYRNDGGRFTDVSRDSGMARPMLPMGANYGDLDNDGGPDIYLGTGEPGYETVMPNVMFRHEGGLAWADVTFAGGFGHLQKGHGVAFGDVDNDGDQDLFHQLGGFFPGDAYANALFENPGPAGAWIALRLEGKKANPMGLGARIEVRVRDGETSRSVHALAGSGGSFGGSSLQQEIGLGRIDAIEEVVIRWPGSGTVQRFAAPAANRFYRAIEGEPSLEPVDLPRIRLGRR